MTLVTALTVIACLSAAAIWAAVRAAADAGEIAQLHLQAQQRRQAEQALARATGTIDVGLQRTTEVRRGLVGGPGQCCSCFKDTDGSPSDDWCTDCLHRLRGTR